MKTETRSKAQGWVFGHELHIAREVVGGSYRGDPTTFTLEGERPMGRITGFDIRPISRDRAGAGLAIVAATKDAHPELREVIVDRGYSNLKKENFRGPLEEMGVASVHSLMPDDLVRQPAVVTVPCGRRSGTGTGKQSVTLLSTAGSLFHELTPPELLENPRLGITGTQQRKDAIEHYEKRTAYLWAPHGSRSNGRLRLKCPVHSGRLRPLDPIEAARTGRFDLPALSTQPGITKCCVQATITITGPAETNGFVNALPMLHHRQVRPIERGAEGWALDEVLTMSGAGGEAGQAWKADATLELFDSPWDDVASLLPVREIISGYYIQVGTSWDGGTTLARR